MDVDPSFERVVGDHYQNLYRFAPSLSQNEADACDLVLQTFSIYARKGHQLRDGSKVKTWLFTTLRREFFSTRRRSERFVDEPPDEATTPDLSEDRLSSLDGEAVMSALGKLPLEYREPLTLFYLEEHSYQDIANQMDIPIGTVMSRLSRAKRRLRALLENE
jgi:RNA polymerase sigma-70 factor (ECF subfamily)